MLNRHGVLLVAGACFAFFTVVAAATETADKTLSPYFLVQSGEDSAVEQFPLESTTADVKISGVIAAVQVEQTYRNRGQVPINAVYVFPASTRAAVNAMTMTIGERTIVADIQEKKQAKKTFEAAKKQGKRASLLEQHRPNVFQMSVANVMPGDTVVVRLEYTELIVPEDGEYAFIYPTVVGPRFNGEAQSVPDAPPINDWVANPYLGEGEPSPYRFDIDVSLNTGIAIKEIASPSHDVRAEYLDEASANVSLNAVDTNAGNRDFILRYRLAGGAIESGLIMHEGEDENFFLLMAEPPKRVAPATIPPREYIFIVDVSGSMYGFPLDTTKQLMSRLLTSLRPSDSFNILFFSGGSSVLSERPLSATRENVQHAITMMNGQRGGGGTRMLSAIRHAMELPSDDRVARSFIMVTDGYVSVETRAFDYVREHLNQANFFAFGIGSSVNRFLIEGLARVGRAAPFVVTDPREAGAAAERFRHYIEAPVLTGIEVDFGELDVFDVEPQSFPDLLAERPLVVFGKWRGERAGNIEVRGMTGQGQFQHRIEVGSTDGRTINPALRYLWARDRIARLGDYEKLSPSSERAREITTLGLTYQLLTAYTSFVAVDSEVVNANGRADKVKQPLPLPKGVSNHAVGGQVPIAPEPEIHALLAVMGLIGLWQVRRRRQRGAAA